ncbi:uncharacterized protein LOC129588964 [Paramacrobiotus metropolitanus]|uniref:uncharacterized protein LOC129588964 n=1 Tax=Paramacrobiotus metropolitanus TaxID=2943436 RepID=UPI002445DD64|nr:uncharacterized protein LOC129588964 [Paramacrobiotus metropolitanus]
MLMLIYLFGVVFHAVIAVRPQPEDGGNTIPTADKERLCLQNKFKEARDWNDERKINAVTDCFPLIRETLEAQIKRFEAIEQRILEIEQLYDQLKDIRSGKVSIWGILWIQLEILASDNGFTLPKPIFVAVVLAIIAGVILVPIGLGYHHNNQRIRNAITIFLGVCITGCLVLAWKLLLPAARVQRAIKQEF